MGIPPKIMIIFTLILLLFGLQFVSSSAARVLNTTKAVPTGYKKLKTSGKSAFYEVELPPLPKGMAYDSPPYLLDLHGSRREIGYDYAAMLHEEASYTISSFLESVFPKPQDRLLLVAFFDFCWTEFLGPATKKSAPEFLEELAGMDEFFEKTMPHFKGYRTSDVSRMFFTLANMPADPQNIIAMLEQELEKGWPQWLKDAVNEIIKLLEKLVHSCDAYGVWGKRTAKRHLYSSRNLDFNSNTGINRYKLVTNYHITDNGKQIPMYSTIGYTFGMGALAGISAKGMTVSEMNLDNSKVTFDGLPFPLRLRAVLERSTDLHSAMTVWNATHNTNSFNFLVASASDAAAGRNGAVALETIRGYTGMFPANSPIEAAATVDCSGQAGIDNHCHKWTTSKSATTRIGFPLPDAVWRSNHGVNPTVMQTQEPLFNNTVYRYNLMHDLFKAYEAHHELIADEEAISIVATLGIKGRNYFTCDQPLLGDNTLSIAYAPSALRFHVAFEAGSGSNWRPAACAPFVLFDMHQWL